MKKLLFFLAITLAGCNCEEDEPTANSAACTSSDPIGEIPWLAEMKEGITNCTCTISIMKGTYQNTSVFFLLMNDPLCNSVGSTDLFDCNGKFVKHISDGAEFTEKVTITEILYSCEE